MVNVTSAFQISGVPALLPNIRYPDPVLVNELTPLNVQPPLPASLLAPVLVDVTVLLKVPPLNSNVDVVDVTAAPKVVPVNVTVVPVMFRLPLFTLPFVIVVTPVVVSVNPPRFNVPLVIVRLVTWVFAAMTQLFEPVTIVTLSRLPGIPFGVQLVFVVHAVDALPFQV